jgi:hypothetical protein
MNRIQSMNQIQSPITDCKEVYRTSPRKNTFRSGLLISLALLCIVSASGCSRTTSSSPVDKPRALDKAESVLSECSCKGCSKEECARCEHCKSGKACGADNGHCDSGHHDCGAEPKHGTPGHDHSRCGAKAKECHWPACKDSGCTGCKKSSCGASGQGEPKKSGCLGVH